MIVKLTFFLSGSLTNQPVVGANKSRRNRLKCRSQTQICSQRCLRLVTERMLFFTRSSRHINGRLTVLRCVLSQKYVHDLGRRPSALRPRFGRSGSASGGGRDKAGHTRGESLPLGARDGHSVAGGGRDSTCGGACRAVGRRQTAVHHVLNSAGRCELTMESKLLGGSCQRLQPGLAWLPNAVSFHLRWVFDVRNVVSYNTTQCSLPRRLVP